MDSWETTGWEAGGSGRSEGKVGHNAHIAGYETANATGECTDLTDDSEGDRVHGRTFPVSHDDGVGACVTCTGLGDHHNALGLTGPHRYSRSCFQRLEMETERMETNETMST